MLDFNVSDKCFSLEWVGQKKMQRCKFYQPQMHIFVALTDGDIGNIQY